MSIFEEASRTRLRFESPRGNLTVEDLWELPLTVSNDQRPSLDAIAMDLYRQVKNTTDVQSFVSETTQVDSKVQLAFDIVKHIITHKKAESAKRQDTKKRADLRAQLMEVLARKKDQQLETLTPEEIQAKIDALSEEPA